MSVQQSKISRYSFYDDMIKEKAAVDHIQEAGT